MSDQKKAVVLLSGGLDSATVLAIARAEGFAVHAMSFHYGQRHVHELRCARRVAADLGVSQHVVVNIDLRTIQPTAIRSRIVAAAKLHAAISRAITVDLEF